MLPLPAKSGLAMGIIVKGVGLDTPAAFIEAVIEALAAYWAYQVPIWTIAAFSDMKLLLASGYCLIEVASWAMIPSACILRMMSRDWTITGSSQLAWPCSAFV